MRVTRKEDDSHLMPSVNLNQQESLDISSWLVFFLAPLLRKPESAGAPSEARSRAGKHEPTIND